MVKVYNLCRVKTDRLAVLTVKSSLDPRMINELEDGIKSWFYMVLEIMILMLNFGMV